MINDLDYIDFNAVTCVDHLLSTPSSGGQGRRSVFLLRDDHGAVVAVVDNGHTSAVRYGTPGEVIAAIQRGHSDGRGIGEGLTFRDVSVQTLNGYTVDHPAFYAEQLR